MYGLFSQYSPFWPYLWRDRRSQGKERPPTLLWSKLLKNDRPKLQTVKKGKGKRKGPSSESEKGSESEDE